MEEDFSVVENNPICNLLLSKLIDIFPKEEHTAFLKESLLTRPLIIRTNTLKIRPKELKKLLTARGVSLEELFFYESAFIIYQSSVPIGATPEYLAGFYVIQGGASFLPVLAMQVQINDVVLDMCAAPGLKSQFIATLTSKYLIANDVNKDRLFAIKANFNRTATQNTIITNYDGRKIKLQTFDKILLDAPCSGTGVIYKDKHVLTKLTIQELKRITLLQKELIVNAFNLLDKNGILVYSTCSVLIDENECVIDYLLTKFKNAKLVELPSEVLKVGRPGFCKFKGKIFCKEMNLTRRIYPHVDNLDGFFVAKITKK